MLSVSSMQTIDVLRSLVGNVPIYHRHDRMEKELPCIIYSKTTACIKDINNKCRFECAHLTKADTIVYTDGGWKPYIKMGVVGIWYGYGDLRNERIEVNADDAFQVELLAIIRVLQRERYATNQSLEIRTDNRTCVGLFHNDNWGKTPASWVVDYFFEIINNYPRPVNIGWVRGHSDWMGNNEADNMTKKYYVPPTVDLHKPRFLCHSNQSQPNQWAHLPLALNV